MKCAHPSCKCNVDNDGRYGTYCSEHCQKAGDSTESQCHCGHPKCR